MKLCANAILTTLIVALVTAMPAKAIETKPGFFSGGSVPPGQIFQCPEPGEYLVGLLQNQTDRIVGAGLVCASTDRTQLWIGDTVVPASKMVGDFHNQGAILTNVTCPKDYFIVGWRGTRGTYKPETHGFAPPGVDLLADLAPVCRRFDGTIFAFNDGRLHQADDNDLHVTPWDGLNGPRSCQAGWAAIGVLFEFQQALNSDPNNQFEDAALICDRLPKNIHLLGGTLHN